MSRTIGTDCEASPASVSTTGGGALLRPGILC